jgi:O-antigen ligase
MSTTSSNIENHKHSLLSIFALACLTLMVSVPFLIPNYQPPIISFYREWLAALFGIMATLYLIGRNQTRFQLPVMTFVPLLLIVVLGLQIWLQNPDYWQNQFFAMLYLGFSALVMVLGSNLRHNLTLERIVPALSWSLLAGSLITIFLIVSSKFIPDGSKLSMWILSGRTGNVGHVNHFSNFLALGLASLFYLQLTRRIKTSLSILFAFLILMFLALGGQRMAILYVLLISAGGWVLLKVALRRDEEAMRPGNLLWLIPGFILAQLIVPIVSFLEPSQMPAERLVKTMSSESSRLIMIEQAWLLFKTNPWLGAGWMEFPWFNFTLTESYPSMKGLWHHAHNIIMQLMAETGIAGLIIFVTGSSYWIWSQFKAPLTAERWWLITLLTIIAVHSLLEYPLWYVNFLAIASLLVGLGAERALTLQFRLAPILFIGVFLFSLWSLGSLLDSYKKVETTINHLRKEGLAASDVEKNLQTLFRLREDTVFTPIADNFLVRVLPNQEQLLADKLKISSFVVENWPGRIESYNHAFLLAMNNKPVEAQAMMRKAIKQYPDYRRIFHRYVLGLSVRGEDRLLPILIILQDPYKAVESELSIDE